jgi:2-succinyl-5-enolpyruvyl-6-hydroxy-3-cyclohexene-1-carboxylate synthase
MTEKRSRGRPKGTGIDDEHHLIAVAVILLDNPKMKPTTAMRRRMIEVKVPDTKEAACLHRWQEKWKAGRDRYIQLAQDQLAARRQSVTMNDVIHMGQLLTDPRLGEWMAKTADPLAKVVQEMQKPFGPLAQALEVMTKRMKDTTDPLTIVMKRLSNPSDQLHKALISSQRRVQGG